MLDHNSPEIKFALHAVRQASILVQQIQAELVSPALSKEDHSPVTVADFASQALIGYLLTEAFPDDPLVAEEDSTALRNPDAIDALEKVTRFVSEFIPQTTPQWICNWIDRGSFDCGGLLERTQLKNLPYRSVSRFWTLDPIDGTKGFLRGDQYAIALALIIGGEVEVSVLGCPKLIRVYHPSLNGPGSLVIAVRNQGAWVTDLWANLQVRPFLDSPGIFERLKVSSQSDPAQARLLRSFESSHTNASQIEAFHQAFGIQVEPVRMDSQAKYAVLAAGKAEILLRLISPSKPDYREKIWDQAAGWLILEEAGGCITDLDGKTLDFRVGRSLIRNRGILASNGVLHRSALQALQKIAV